MRRFSYKKYLVMGAALFLTLSLPALVVEKMRSTTIGFFSYFFKGGALLKRGSVKEQHRLEGENYLLRIEIGKLRAILDQNAKVEKIDEELRRNTLSSKHYEEMRYLSQQLHPVIPARVIYRDPGSWSSSLWVNVGEETNHLLSRDIICKNSPVLLGRGVVGVIDYVGKKQSRIRLITDVALKPSVRAVRGHPQAMALIDHIEPIVRHLSTRNEVSLSTKEKEALANQLKKLRDSLYADGESYYLAKGILQGGGTPIWRNVNHTLRGIGFNYDFADDEGPARELQSGKPILEVGDLLVTTGMDGVFPPGLSVAEVAKISPLREGAYTYEIEASPVVGNLDTLQTVFIISPLGYEEEQKS